MKGLSIAKMDGKLKKTKRGPLTRMAAPFPSESLQVPGKIKMQPSKGELDLGEQLTFGPVTEFGDKKQKALAIPRPTEARDALEEEYSDIIETNRWLDRTLVSFQANKALPFYRWFKYREGFAAPMVSKIVSTLHPVPGELLDPFGGAGAALFASRTLGWTTTGIELLPSARFGILSRLAAEDVDSNEFSAAITQVQAQEWINEHDGSREFQHIRITAGAFPEQTEQQLNAFLGFVRRSEYGEATKQLLRFAAYCILEDISYTRKDGQYLRWDYRSGRQLGVRQFDKGAIEPFVPTLMSQLRMMESDLSGDVNTLFDTAVQQQGDVERPRLIAGSCLDELPNLATGSFDCVFTSPPYCNRYDYTRTYALELAFLGCGEEEVKKLRQQMLFCTVENKEKADLAGKFGTERYNDAVRVFEHQAALQEVLGILDTLRDLDELNNPGIAKLVRNYFFEMNLVIRECARVLRPGGHFVMVNDNVRYAGETVAVDTILSEFADAAGMEPLHIWKLGTGKGNSSQQMGVHGRTELRKSICVWQKR